MEVFGSPQKIINIKNVDTVEQWNLHPSFIFIIFKHGRTKQDHQKGSVANR